MPPLPSGAHDAIAAELLGQLERVLAGRRGHGATSGAGVQGGRACKDVVNERGVFGQARPILPGCGLVAALHAVMQVQVEQLAQQAGAVWLRDLGQEVLQARPPAGQPVGLEAVARRVDAASLSRRQR